MKDPETVQRLIRLKRYETPGEEYFGSFLAQRQERQRSELLRRSSREILAERFSDWCDETIGRRWLVPVGAAAVATLGAGLYFALPVRESIVSADTVAVSTSAEADHASVQAVAIATPPGTFETAPAEENFSLQLPRPSGRVPAFEQSGEATGGRVVPVSALGEFREL